MSPVVTAVHPNVHWRVIGIFGIFHGYLAFLSRNENEWDGFVGLLSPTRKQIIAYC